MDWKHFAVGAVLFIAGFYIAKKYPSLFSGIPGLNKITG